MRLSIISVVVLISTILGNGLTAGSDGECAGAYDEIAISEVIVACSDGDHTVIDEAPFLLTAAATDTKPLSCSGDGRDGPRLQAMFVTSGVGSPDILAMIERDIEGVEAIYADSAAIRNGPELGLRWVHGGDCRVVIETIVVNPQDLSDFEATINAVRVKGFDQNDRKYVMWVDANVVCGIASVFLDDSPEASNLNNGRFPSYARIDRPCWGSTVSGHEITHTLGAVLPSSPNSTAFGHCQDEFDLMCYRDAPSTRLNTVCPAPELDRMLDCGSDDYFSFTPVPGSWIDNHWNVVHSDFLWVSDRAVFSDVAQSHPFRDEIGWLADQGITQGCSPGAFCPDAPVSREQMAAFLRRGLGGEKTAVASFGDVSADSAFAGDIGWLVAQGITAGCGSDEFCPGAPVTRGQMAAFLRRGLGGESAKGLGFSDVGPTNIFAGDIAWLTDHGITKGCGAGHFCPNDVVTRGQMAVFLYRALGQG